MTPTLTVVIADLRAVHRRAPDNMTEYVTVGCLREIPAAVAFYNEARDSLPALLDAAERAERAEAENAKLRVALEAHETWEADIILNADWENSCPTLTQVQMNALTAVQEKRNTALGGRQEKPPKP